MNSMEIVGSKLVGDDVLPFMVEVDLVDDNSKSFLRVRESLTRIGVEARRQEDPKNTLFQTCHILSKNGRLYVCHFKTMFVLEGRENCLTPGDIARQNAIIKLLEGWGLIKVKNPGMIKESCSVTNIKIVKFEDKDNWNLTPKYNVGGRERRKQNREVCNQ